MEVNYNKLWKLLIDRKMMKTELMRTAGISSNALAKMGKGQPVTMDCIAKICAALDCTVDDILEFVP